MSENDQNFSPDPTDSAESTESLDSGVKKTHLRSRVLLIIGIVLLSLLLIGGGLVLGALRQLRQLRGEEQIPIVSRDSEYVIPEPEDTIVRVPDDTIPDVPDETDTEAVTEPIKTDPTPIYSQIKKDPDVTNVLLLGRDSRNATVENGRTDAMIILSYNKRTHEVKLISLMRDMLIPIEGHDWNRINTAFAFGGIGLCINTLNDVFQLDIQDYMTIDFDGLVSVIDAIGGIELSLTADEVALYQEYGMLDSSAAAGIHHFDGEMALRHARNRALGSDFERTRRQRDILMAIFNKVTTSMSLTDVTSLVSSVLKIVKTNLSSSTLVSLAADVMTNKSSITFTNARLPFNDTYNGAWYKKMYVIEIDIEENTRLLHELLYGTD